MKPLALPCRLVVLLLVGLLLFLRCGGDGDTSAHAERSWTLDQIGYLEIPYNLPAILTTSGLLMGGEGMHLVSLETPSDPTVFDVGPQAQATRDWYLRASTGGYIYARALWEHEHIGRLRIINASMPFDNIAAEIELELGSSYIEPAVTGIPGTMYVLNCLESLRKIDLSNPLSPRITATYAINACQIRCFGDTLFLCCWGSGIYALDVTRSQATPTLYVDTSDEAVDIVCSQTHAYIADRRQGVQIASRTHPPELVARIPSSRDSTEYVAIVEGMLYVSDGSLLQVFDTTTPRNPAAVAERSFNGPCYRAMQHGDHVVVFSEVSHSPYTLGLHVLKLRETNT